jgi:hypothetical protein
MAAQQGQPAIVQQGQPITAGRPTDWTHHHLVFSNPATFADAAAHGTAFQWQSTVNNTRYVLQQMRRNPARRPPRSPENPLPGVAIHQDWNEPLSAGLVNPNTYPAKYSFNTTAYSCTADYVVYPTGIAGSGTTQATIVAYRELYGTSGPSGTGCGAGSGGATVPSTYWAYNTAFVYSTNAADTSKVTTSPILSLDGSQIAFVQVASSVASLVILKHTSGTSVVALNTAATNVSPANYRACTAPCMTRITLSNSANITWSSPYYDYSADDALYIGDDSGKLHRFAGIFYGTPTETGAPYPVALSGVLASQVYDSTSGYIFIGNTAGTLYSVVASSGTLHATSATLAENTHGIFDAPLVDSSAGKVYVFVGQSVGIAGAGCATPGNNCVYQFATSFANASSGLSQPVGTGGATAGQQYLFAGAFDNIYFSSTNGTAGNLYVAGNTGSTSGSLYQIPISSSGLMRTPVAFSSGAGTTPPYASPLTEFCNNGTSACVSSGTATTSGTDYLFLSGSDPAVCGASSGCLLAVNISSGSPSISALLDLTYGAHFNCFSTGGIIVDYAVPSGMEAGASEVYVLGLGGTTTNLCGAANTPATGSLLGIQSAQ